MNDKTCYNCRHWKHTALSDFERTDLPRNDFESREEYIKRLKIAGLPLEVKE